MNRPNHVQPVKVVLFSLLLLATVSYVDYVTGYELLFFVFYFLPVGLCAWHLGRLATLSLAVLSAASWFSIDRLSGHQYSHEAFRYWNSFTCFLAFACLGLALLHLKDSREEERKLRRGLEKALAELQASTEELRDLQNQTQTLCAWTHRIHNDGRWVALDEFLTGKLNFKISHGISPEAFEAMTKPLDPNGPTRS